MHDFVVRTFAQGYRVSKRRVAWLGAGKGRRVLWAVPCCGPGGVGGGMGIRGSVDGRVSDWALGMGFLHEPADGRADVACP